MYGKWLDKDKILKIIINCVVFSIKNEHSATKLHLLISFYFTTSTINKISSVFIFKNEKF